MAIPIITWGTTYSWCPVMAAAGWGRGGGGGAPGWAGAGAGCEAPGRGSAGGRRCGERGLPAAGLRRG